MVHFAEVERYPPMPQTISARHIKQRKVIFKSSKKPKRFVSRLKQGLRAVFSYRRIPDKVLRERKVNCVNPRFAGVPWQGSARLIRKSDPARGISYRVFSTKHMARVLQARILYQKNTQKLLRHKQRIVQRRHIKCSSLQHPTYGPCRPVWALFVTLWLTCRWKTMAQPVISEHSDTRGRIRRVSVGGLVLL